MDTETKKPEVTVIGLNEWATKLVENMHTMERPAPLKTGGSCRHTLYKYLDRQTGEVFLEGIQAAFRIEQIDKGYAFLALYKVDYDPNPILESTRTLTEMYEEIRNDPSWTFQLPQDIFREEREH